MSGFLTFLLALVIFVGLVVFLVAWVYAYIIGPWVYRAESNRNRAISIGLCLIFATPIVLGLRERERLRQGDRNTYALLAGDQSVRITRLGITGQEREVDCTDPTVLRYFEDCLRSHLPYESARELGQTGLTYHLELTFEDGSEYSGSTFWGSNRFDFFVDGETDVGWPTHAVLFRPPMPEGMKRIYDYLDLQSKSQAAILRLE